MGGFLKFLEVLENVLLQDDRFVGENNVILKPKVYEACMNMDPALLKLLLADEMLKKHFFVDVDGMLVFDKIKFSWVLESREFLPDSYTLFKNKIGLADRNNNLLSSKNDVSLVWPYKDCILEGGQTKDDQKRDEIFYNEILAPDEVNRLLHPKVFTNAKRYTRGGVEEIDSINEDDNLIIKGNNLLTLSALLKTYKGEVNCIYIDPPFNTGNDSFNYNDRFSRSAWLTFMENRLKIAKKLLTLDGNIFIHIDINQGHYLKVLCDEIFGEENFVQEIIWSYGSPSGGRAGTPKPVNIHDYILHYAASYKERKQNRVYTPYSEKYIRDWFKFFDEDGRQYRRRQRGEDEAGQPIWIRQYLDESNGMPLTTVWNDIKQVYADPRAYRAGNKADVEVIKEFSGGQKPEALIKRILEMSTDEGDLILDFHAGTGTTGATAHKMNRRYILCEQIDNQMRIITERVIKVMTGETAGISKDVDWEGGGSFVYCELMEQNESLVSDLRNVQTSEEIQEVLSRAMSDGALIPSVTPEELRSNMDDFASLPLGEQKQLVMELIDKNRLYVNLCDMDDEDMAVTEKDKAFTRSFYSLDKGEK